VLGDRIWLIGGIDGWEIPGKAPHWADGSMALLEAGSATAWRIRGFLRDSVVPMILLERMELRMGEY